MWKWYWYTSRLTPAEMPGQKISVYSQALPFRAVEMLGGGKNCPDSFLTDTGLRALAAW